MKKEISKITLNNIAEPIVMEFTDGSSVITIPDHTDVPNEIERGLAVGDQVDLTPKPEKEIGVNRRGTLLFVGSIRKSI